MSRPTSKLASSDKAESATVTRSSADSPPDSSLSAPVFRCAIELSPKQRENIAAWKAQLNKCIERREDCAGPRSSPQLEIHFNSSLVGAIHAIRDLCLPLAGRN
jgi:hypothetical protein